MNRPETELATRRQRCALQRAYSPFLCRIAAILPFLAGALLAASSPAAVPAPPAADELVPCKVRQTVPVQFPVRALHEGIVHGGVSLMVEVFDDGRLGDVLAFRHSGVDFARAAVEAVRKWEFKPASFKGEAIRANLVINVAFEVNGVTAYTKLVGQAEEQSSGQRYVYRPFTLGELDRVPRPLATPSPVYPREWLQQGKTGEVTIDYFIDEEGRARFPQVVDEADEMLGAVTVEAVKGWQFEPPIRRGQPVLAVVRQSFHFGLPRRRSAEPARR